MSRDGHYPRFPPPPGVPVAKKKVLCLYPPPRTSFLMWVGGLDRWVRPREEVVCGHADAGMLSIPPSRALGGLVTGSALLMPCCVHATGRKANMQKALSLAVRIAHINLHHLSLPLLFEVMCLRVVVSQ